MIASGNIDELAGVGNDDLGVSRMEQGLRGDVRNDLHGLPEDLQMLLGYAGWGPGQLEAELAEGAWLVAPVSCDVVFEVEPSVMWDHVLRSLGIEPSTLVASRGIH